MSFLLCFIQQQARLYVPVVVLLMIGTVVHARTEDRLVRQIDSLVQLQTPKKFNGVVLVKQRANVLYATAHGLADVEKRTPLTLKTQFGAGSVSKQFTAVLVLQEMEKGRLKLDDPVRKYLPELTMPWADSVTVRQLLNHTSGLIRTDTSLAFKPGTACLYSNTGYQLLGRIVEHTSGRSFCELVSALFARCGMSQTADPSLCRNNVQQLAQGYTVHDGKLQQTADMTGLLQYAGAASGGIIATAGDLARWNECLHGGKLLQPASYRMMMQPSGKIRQHTVFGGISYGFGLPFNMHSDIQEICHSGVVSGSGFYCLYFYYPATKTSIVVMENIADESGGIKEMFFFETAIAAIVKQEVLPVTTRHLKQKNH